MPSDYVLQEINSRVYRIDSKDEGYEPLKIGEREEIKGYEYQVLKTEDNTSNGMQAMAVAPVKDGKADTSEVVLAYAGTNFDDGLDLHTDIQTVILGNKNFIADNVMRVGALPVPTSIEDSQIITAEKFAEDIKADYPNSEVTTTGHSLGEYLALYVSAENGWGNVGFNGPDPYDILSSEAKQWVEGNSDMLFNYRNKADIVGNFGGNGTGAGIPVDMGMAKMIDQEDIKDMDMTDVMATIDTDDIKGAIDSHRLTIWEFDEDGNVEIDSSYDNQTAHQIQGEKLWYGKMAELSLLANKLQASGGGLSSNEVIFLNNAQSLLAVEYITKSTKAAIESVVDIYKKAIDELEDNWDKGIQLARLVGPQLSYPEILEALEAGGVTKFAVLFEPMAYYRGKITEALKIGEGFDSLASDIKENIEKLIETDEDLANQIEQGV